MIDKLINMPKVELHLHLDGSVSIDLLKELSGLSEEEIREKCVSKHNQNLGEYLKCFDFVIDNLQTRDALEKASYELVRDLEKEHVIYAEIRFAPLSHTKGGLTPSSVVDAVLSGLSKGNIKTGLILCLRRGAKMDDNYKVLELANKYLNKGVVAVDLVGDESNFSFLEYSYLFKVCRNAKIPFTIHAGETDKFDLDYVIPFTNRIGHGIKCVDDEELIQEIKDNNILLEICPNSNIDTGNVKDYPSHPIKKLYDLGIDVSINTDNRTVSDITLNDEYINLYKTFHFTIDDFKKMNIMAINHAFLNDEDKRKLKEEIEKY